MTVTVYLSDMVRGIVLVQKITAGNSGYSEFIPLMPCAVADTTRIQYGADLLKNRR